MRVLALFLFAAMASAQSPEQPPRRALLISQIVLASATTTDVLSSRGGVEANPFVGRGQFGARQISIALGSAAALILIERHIAPRMRKAFIWMNYGIAGAHAAAVVHNGTQ